MLYSSLSSPFSFGRSAAYLSTRRLRSSTGCIPHLDASRCGLVGAEFSENKDRHVTFVLKMDAAENSKNSGRISGFESRNLQNLVCFTLALQPRMRALISTGVETTIEQHLHLAEHSVQLDPGSIREMVRVGF